MSLVRVRSCRHARPSTSWRRTNRRQIASILPRTSAPRPKPQCTSTRQWPCELRQTRTVSIPSTNSFVQSCPEPTFNLVEVRPRHESCLARGLKRAVPPVTTFILGWVDQYDNILVEGQVLLTLTLVSECRQHAMGCGEEKHRKFRSSTRYAACLPRNLLVVRSIASKGSAAMAGKVSCGSPLAESSYA